MLATGRKHEAVISYLKRETKQRKSLFPRFDFWWVANKNANDKNIDPKTVNILLNVHQINGFA